jgi:hypothetical protein
MTERRRPLDNGDGQESLFGGEAFALTPGAPASWQRPAPERDDARSGDAAREAEGASVPQAAASGAQVSAPLGEAQASSLEGSMRAPLEEAQAGAFEAQVEVEYQAGAPAEDLGAYVAEADSGADLLAGPVPTEVPAYDAGVELEALERATVGVGEVRQPRAPLAGPTLDDLVSRVWEGLVTGLPAACPVCRGEVVASFAGSLHGGCSSCGTTIE